MLQNHRSVPSHGGSTWAVLTPQDEGKVQAIPSQGADQSPAGEAKWGTWGRVTSGFLASREVAGNVECRWEPHS